MKPHCFLLICFSLTVSASAQLRLPRLVRDSMVLQRDQQLKLWGWASAGEKITIQFNGKRASATTGPDGKWTATLPAMKAGGPYTMKVSGKTTIELKDVLIGDVWVCAGQSNMVHQMELHKNWYEQDILQANNPHIRQFWVPNINNLIGPAEDLPGGNWKWANPEDVRQFSAVAYFFAQNIYEKYKVPIGIINASIGGTPVEAWTSEDGLKSLPEWDAIVQQNKDTGYVNRKNREAAEANRPLSRRGSQDLGMNESPRWYDPAYNPVGWSRIQVPGYWEDAGVRNLDGIVWYRKEIDVPASMTTGSAVLHLGRIVDADVVYINGKQVGQTTYQYPQRRYNVPVGVLKAGKNVITVKVSNSAGKGGFVPDKPYHLAAGDQKIDLTGYWQYKVGEVFTPHRPTVSGISAQNAPTALYNAMIAPIKNYAIKGVLWYQGESNAGNPKAYAKLQPAFVKDWRKQWNRPDLPFITVQLPGFMDMDYLPAESDWALMREVQANTSMGPNSGFAVAIDLGEWNDIHPDNKKDVGVRAALVARHVAYGENLVYSGPQFAGMTVEGNQLKLKFDHVGGGLVTKDGGAPKGFAIAGADGKFVWAQARIEGETVVLWNPDISEPKHVRYAWADNPHLANVYNREGLPAAPFRTDGNQPGLSASASR